MHAGVIQKRGSDVAWMASFIYSINIQSGSPGCKSNSYFIKQEDSNYTETNHQSRIFAKFIHIQVPL